MPGAAGGLLAAPITIRQVVAYHYDKPFTWRDRQVNPLHMYTSLK